MPSGRTGEMIDPRKLLLAWEYGEWVIEKLRADRQGEFLDEREVVFSTKHLATCGFADRDI
jgi:hypothetical protein